MLHVNVGGLDFFGHKGPFGLKPGGFTGWDDGVATRTKSILKENDGGAYELPVYREQRFITLAGNVIGGSPEELGYLRTRLLGALSTGKPGRITVSRPWETRWATCYLDGQPRFTERGGLRSGTFELNLRCPDPRKFGGLRRFEVEPGLSVKVSHYGNYGATPKFTVTGSMPGGYKLTVGGRSFVVTQPLVNGVPHTIDYQDARLRVGGVVVFGGVSISNVWRVEPGVEELVTLEPLTVGSGTAVLELLDTYI
jgi:hypothetical protein